MLRRPDDPALARPIVDEQGSAVAADIPAGDAGIVAGPDLDGDHHTVVELEERFETVVALLIIDVVHLAEDRRDLVGSIHHHDLVEQMDAPVEHHAAAGHGILPPALRDAAGAGDAGHDLKHVAEQPGVYGFEHSGVIRVGPAVLVDGERLPVRRAVSIMVCSSPLLIATGFSQTTALPASSAWQT